MDVNGVLHSRSLGPGGAARPRGAGARARAADAHAPVRVSKPVGESGAVPIGARESDSFLRFHLIEGSHLPAQRRRVQAAGGSVLAQGVRLRVEVRHPGRPVAVAGEAESLARDAHGRHEILRELAYVSELRQLTLSGGAALTALHRRSMPRVQLNTGSLLEGLRTLRARRALGRAARPSLTEFFRSLSPRALEEAADAFPPVMRRLGTVHTSFAPLAERSTFAARAVTSSQPAAITAEASGEAALGEHRVRVLQAAQAHAVDSDEVGLDALGFSGEFVLNRSVIEVAPEDSIVDLARRISRGEDLNGSGELDDWLDEDENANGELDGGTREHGAVATVVGERLRLAQAEAGAAPLVVEDNDEILLALGVLERDDTDLPRFAHEVRAAQGAKIEIDGMHLTRDTNEIADAVEGLLLRVRGPTSGEAALTVAFDASVAVGRVEAAVEDFNAAMRAMNRLLVRGGLLAEDPALTRVRQDLVASLASPVAGQPADLDEASEAGVTRAGDARTTFALEALAAGARAIAAGGAPSMLRNAESPSSILNSIAELGITAGEDGTFSADREHLERVLRDRGEEVASLFTREEEGVAARVTASVEGAIGPSGLLLTREGVLLALLGARLGRAFGQAELAAHRGAIMGALLGVA